MLWPFTPTSPIHSSECSSAITIGATEAISKSSFDDRGGRPTALARPAAQKKWNFFRGSAESPNDSFDRPGTHTTGAPSRGQPASARFGHLLDGAVYRRRSGGLR